MDIRAPGPKELRLVPAGNSRGHIAPRTTQGPASALQVDGMSNCVADGWIFVIAFQAHHVGLTREGSAGF